MVAIHTYKGIAQLRWNLSLVKVLKVEVTTCTGAKGWNLPL